MLTRPAKIRQNRDPTRPDPTRGSIRPVDNSGITIDFLINNFFQLMYAIIIVGTYMHVSYLLFWKFANSAN